MEWTTVFTIREGRILNVEYFWDHAEALEAAGLTGVGDVAGERGDRQARRGSTGRRRRFLENLDPESMASTFRAGRRRRRPISGFEGVRAWLRDVCDAFDEFKSSSGVHRRRRRVVVARSPSRGREGQRRRDRAGVGCVCDVRDGKIIRLEPTWTTTKPSKPPGSRSRRCRRRTWRSCAGLSSP